MKVDVLGGGPGGLYASILLQKRNPDWEVTVYERNPADVTYGWGIVFPDRSLPNLREADPESHRRITEEFHRWDPIDVFVNEQRFRCGGHAFASMLRTDLLGVLQERCRELGVDLQFETRIGDPAELAAEADLLVGADGINSYVRDRYAAEFDPTLLEGTDRFAWFGTETQFDALTHTFDENEDGVWRIHAYPGKTSTFIVDCDAETWRNSGMAEMSEAEYIAYLEDLFSWYLDGSPVLSKQDKWRTFTTVTNQTWFHDNVVLVGDAAHTAHYSIGSGTTLAMEDAIGLADAFERHDDVEAALPRYESRRKPVVESLQGAAERSRVHYENIRRYMHLAPPQLTFHHLTRTGRVTYDSLRRRDASYVDSYDRWFAARARGHALDDAIDGADPPLAQPLWLRDVAVPNRLAFDVTPEGDADGRPAETTLSALVDHGRGGAGLVVAGPVAAGDGDAPTLSDAAMEAWADAVDGVHGTSDAVVGVRLSVESGDAPEDVAAAVRRAGDAGFDLLELDADYAADDDPFTPVEAAREAWTGERPMAATLRADIADRGGLVAADAVGVAADLADLDCDLLAVRTAGAPEPEATGTYADRVRNAAGLPTLATGIASTADDANTAVAAGRADLCTLHPSLADGEDLDALASFVDEELL